MTHRSLIQALLFSIIGSILAEPGVGQEATKKVKLPQTMQRLVTITDFDAAGQIETVRSEMEFDKEHRRQANKVFDARKQLIATERFRYDRQGRLSGREYLTAGTKLKWRWQRVQHNNAGDPTRNDIVNSKDKKIGWYIWHYDKQGRLTRRDRFNSDGTLRFYYANVKFDMNGDFSRWTKYDAKGRKIGSKKWDFTTL